LCALECHFCAELGIQENRSKGPFIIYRGVDTEEMISV